MAALLKNRFPIPSWPNLTLFGVLSLTSLTAIGAELTVQIGAFGDRPNTRFAEEAAEYGELLVLRGDDGITRVSIGRYDTKSAAREALQRLQIAGYTDAYISNVRGRDSQMSAPAAGLPAAPTVNIPQAEPSSISSREATTDRPFPTTPEGRPVVAPKQPTGATEASTTQAGRFRLRTHDTKSGQTSDVRLTDTNTTSGGIEPVITGLGANDVPQHLRDKLVYLDGVPHIKDGEQFVPLNDAIDGK